MLDFQDEAPFFLRSLSYGKKIAEVLGINDLQVIHLSIFKQLHCVVVSFSN